MWTLRSILLTTVSYGAVAAVGFTTREYMLAGAIPAYINTTATRQYMTATGYINET